VRQHHRWAVLVHHVQRELALPRGQIELYNVRLLPPGKVAPGVKYTLAIQADVNAAKRPNRELGGLWTCDERSENRVQRAWAMRLQPGRRVESHPLRTMFRHQQDDIGIANPMRGIH
jgi:hypothetical protein